MTNSTADAAKLLPCPTCKSEKPGWRRIYIAGTHPTLCRDPYHDTRPQPAPPAGEPDEATIERVAEAIAMAGTSHFGDDTPYAQQNHLVKMMRRYEAKAAIEAYGLAARQQQKN